MAVAHCWPHANDTILVKKEFGHSYRIHHHGEGEKARHNPANKRGALGKAFFYLVVVSWRFVQEDRQFLFNPINSRIRRLRHESQGAIWTPIFQLEGTGLKISAESGGSVKAADWA